MSDSDRCVNLYLGFVCSSIFYLWKYCSTHARSPYEHNLANNVCALLKSMYTMVVCWRQWLKWFCEAGGAHLTMPGCSKPHTHSNPTNLALFRHKITLYRFNRGVGAHTIAGGLKWEEEAKPAQAPPLTLTTGCRDCTYTRAGVMWSLYVTHCQSLRQGGREGGRAEWEDGQVRSVTAVLSSDSRSVS